MKLRFVVVSQTVVLEKDNGMPSAINIVDGIEFRVSPESILPTPFELPLGVVLLTAWHLLPGESAQEPQYYRLFLTTPTRRYEMEASEPQGFRIDFDGAPRSNARQLLPSISFEQSGEYVFEVVDALEPGTIQGIWTLSVALSDL